MSKLPVRIWKRSCINRLVVHSHKVSSHACLSSWCCLEGDIGQNAPLQVWSSLTTQAISASVCIQLEPLCC